VIALVPMSRETGAVCATTLVEVAVRGDAMVDVVVEVASVDVAALEAMGVGERHGVVGARGRT
jgi:hypothetical protein